MADIVDDPSTTVTLTPVFPVVSAIDVEGDVDLVRVNLIAGRSYQFDMVGNSSSRALTLTDPLLRLFDVNMRMIAMNDDGPFGTDAQLQFTATASGTYFLAAAAFSGTGTYQLSMDDTVRADDYGQTIITAGTITLDRPLSGAIDYSGDRDWFGIHLAAGTTYEFSLSGADGGRGTLADPMLFLYDETGALIGENDDATNTLDSLLTITPNKSGTYYLGAWSYSVGQGTYQIAARNVSAGNPVPATGVSLVGGNGSDDLVGGAGDDRFYGAGGDDHIVGAAGLDTAVYDALIRQASIAFRNGSLVTSSGVDGSDTLSSVERLQFKDAAFVLDVNSDGAQLQRLYDAVLHRAPDQPGLEHWLDMMHDEGQTIGTVAAHFLNSPELHAAVERAGIDVQSNGDYVEFLYNQVLGRPSDPDGRAGWVRALDGGMARSDALLSFSESDEHRAATTALTAQGYVETDDAYQMVALLYDSFANRLPDAAGLIGWAEALKGGMMTAQQVAAGFAASDEFSSRTSGLGHDQLIDFMYHNTLGREPEAEGKAGWVDALDHGLTVGDMLLTFAQSAEHQALMAPHIYGGIALL